MINWILEEKIKLDFFKGKAILIFGHRQVGNTTLLKKITKNFNDVLRLNAGNIEIQTMFQQASATRLKSVIKTHKIVIIDKAQSIKGIGNKLKIIIDEINETQLIAIGSSAFDLENELNEPLTGRKLEHLLFPVSFEEMANYHGLFQELNLLSNRFIFGYYHDVVINQNDEKRILNQLADSYLFNDILIWNKNTKTKIPKTFLIPTRMLL